MTGSAAIFGIAVGMLSVIIWDFIAKANVELFTELGFLPGFEIIPGFILSTLAIIIVSLNSKPPANSILQEFDEVVKICSS
jgi:Na+/proline symporter